MGRRRLAARNLGLGTLLLLNLAGVSCTNLHLARYRDDRLLAEYRYALGEQYLEVDGLRLCYQELGQGPPVLILPGLGTSIDFWQLNVPTLAEHFRVIALDPPGFGKSDKPDASYELPWIQQGVLAFLDAKQIERTSIIGGSLGGHLGLLLALDHPERVDKLVMMGSTGAWPPPHLLLDVGISLLWSEWLISDYLRGHWPEIYALMFKHESEVTHRLFRYQMALRANGARYAPEGRAASRALRSIFFHSCRDRLGELSVPLLLIWGESDRIHPPEEGLYIRRHAPDARLVIVPEAGHEVMMDQPEAFNRLMIAFLQGGTASLADQFVEP
jgi:pimeloyl-ACP methyl ester carboxylesterase